MPASLKPLRQNTGLLKGLLVMLGIAGLLLLIAGTLLWHRTAAQQRRLAAFNRQLAVAPLGEGQLHDLAAEAAALGRPLPEAGYAALYRRWQEAMMHFRQVSAALGNRYLEPQAAEQLVHLHQDLLTLKDTGVRLLAAAPRESPQTVWKIHNLKGNISVLLAYSTLYHGQDGHKAAGFLSEALEDYKTAIRLVDQTDASPLERILPRWNLELITGVGQYSKIGFAEIPQADLVRVRDQLQTFIPEVPGFSPGIPLETRVEK